MFGNALYEAMLREEVDELAAERQRRQISRPAPAPSPKDIEQDYHIRMVERENRRLKGCFAGLVHVLLEKKLLTEADVREVLHDAHLAAKGII